MPRARLGAPSHHDQMKRDGVPHHQRRAKKAMATALTELQALRDRQRLQMPSEVAGAVGARCFWKERTDSSFELYEILETLVRRCVLMDVTLRLAPSCRELWCESCAR